MVSRCNIVPCSGLYASICFIYSLIIGLCVPAAKLSHHASYAQNNMRTPFSVCVLDFTDLVESWFTEICLRISSSQLYICLLRSEEAPTRYRSRWATPCSQKPSVCYAVKKFPPVTEADEPHRVHRSLQTTHPGASSPHILICCSAETSRIQIGSDFF
jgi:hypothetical protein